MLHICLQSQAQIICKKNEYYSAFWKDFMLKWLGEQLGSNKFEVITMFGFKMEFIMSCAGTGRSKMLSTHEVYYIETCSCAY